MLRHEVSFDLMLLLLVLASVHMGCCSPDLAACAVLAKLHNHSFTL
jgi:hypothetical protein